MKVLITVLFALSSAYSYSAADNCMKAAKEVAVATEKISQQTDESKILVEAVSLRSTKIGKLTYYVGTKDARNYGRTGYVVQISDAGGDSCVIELVKVVSYN